MKNQVGIWLDFREAWLISLSGGEPNVEHIESAIDTGSVKGGSRSKEPWGPMENTSESKMLERRKSEEGSYFRKIMAAVADAREIYIFGPAEAKDGLVKAIKADHLFSPHVLGIETADSMTMNQKTARVKQFFQGSRG